MMIHSSILAWARDPMGIEAWRATVHRITNESGTTQHLSMLYAGPAFIYLFIFGPAFRYPLPPPFRSRSIGKSLSPDFHSQPSRMSWELRAHNWPRQQASLPMTDQRFQTSNASCSLEPISPNLYFKCLSLYLRKLSFLLKKDQIACKPFLRPQSPESWKLWAPFHN